MSDGYKYEIGDKVQYERALYRDVECKACGHIETEYDTEKREGVIQACKYEYVFTVANGFVTENDTTVEDGVTIHRPHLVPPQLQGKMPVYKVDGAWYTEANLKLL